MKLVSRSNKGKRQATTARRSPQPPVSSESGRGEEINRTGSSNQAAPRQSNGNGADPAAPRQGNGTIANQAAQRQADSKSNGRDSAKSKEKVKKPPKKISPVKTVLIIVLIMTIGAAALFVSVGYYVRSLDTIFPNVWVDNINVSEMTFDDAVQTLINEGYEKIAESTSVTMIFPDESRFTLTGVEVGLTLDATEAATAAFAFGRQESFFANEITYIRALFNRTDIPRSSAPDMDTSALRLLATEYTENYNKTLFDSTIERHFENLYFTVVKGQDIIPADPDEVFNLALSTLLRAVEADEHLTATYTPARNLDNDIDLHGIFEEVHMEPIAAMWDKENQMATPSSEGRTFDLEDAMQRLRNANYGEVITVEIEVLPPAYTQEQIEAMLFRDVLGERTSRMANNSSRTHNIRLTAEKINGTVLNPGEEFSFNRIVGRRTQAAGFLQANVIRDGVFQPDWGGGICQTSSTIYAALMQTHPDHINVTERRPHRFTIGYLPDGLDATVAYGNTDFRFVNNTDFPLRIEVTTRGQDITAKLIGTNMFEDLRVEIETSVVSRTAVTTRYDETDELLIGQEQLLAGSSGQPGVVVDVFRVIYNANDEEVGRVRVRSSYSMQQRVYMVGTREPEPEPPTPPTPPGGGEGGGEGGGGGGGEGGGDGGGGGGGDGGGDGGDDGGDD